MAEPGNIETKETLDASIVVLRRGENGVELGEYKKDITQMHVDIFPDDLSLDEAERVVEERARTYEEAVVLAINKEEVIGFGTIWKVQKNGDMYLTTAYVKPSYRQKGVYTQLLDKRIEIAKDCGATTVSIESIKSNPVQETYFSKYGFEKTDEYTFKKSMD